VLLLPTLSAALIATQAPLVAPPPRLPLPRPSPNAIRASVHSNHSPAGTRAAGSLTIALDVVESAWKPEGDTDPEVPILAFAERGKSPLVPGPMIRVPQGTEVRLTLRNSVDSAITVGGLRPGVSLGADARDTLTIAAGATRELRYRLDKPGSYFYWGAFGGTTIVDRLWKDSQLNGAIIVDPPGAARPDHVFLISEWFHPYPDRPFEVVSVINGKAFPYTERLTLPLGDSVRFRVLNTLTLYHPMHLHGFYYRVLARGAWDKDGPIAPAMQPLLNTDLLPPASTLTLAFVPTTPGNWLFHCHFSFHMDDDVTLSGSPPDSASMAAPNAMDRRPSGSAEHHMHGLVIGITVPPPPGYAAREEPSARDIRLLVQRKPNGLLGGAATAYGFVIQKGDSVPPRDSVDLPSPVLELERGKPVRITVVNNLSEPTGIHWHGLEIPSFPDGVPNWSGMGDRIFRPIEPGGTFVAAFTPPRSGTFPFHSHLNERHQIQSGMYGAIIVTDRPRDLAHDHLVLVGGGGPAVYGKTESPYAMVNGRQSPEPLRLTAGEAHRIRIVSIHPDWRILFSLRNDSSIARWRPVAKDGHDLPAQQATVRPANVEMGPGETADFEFRPAAPGKWRLEIRSSDPGWSIPLDVIVVPAATAKRGG
jgi:FtsP/CotA-like multicopper oxidase with cupredoxin domain